MKEVYISPKIYFQKDNYFIYKKLCMSLMLLEYSFSKNWFYVTIYEIFLIPINDSSFIF